MKKATRADVALLNSGTMRSDSLHDAGKFRMEVCTYVRYQLLSDINIQSVHHVLSTDNYTVLAYTHVRLVVSLVASNTYV